MHFPVHQKLLLYIVLLRDNWFLSRILTLIMIGRRFLSIFRSWSLKIWDQMQISLFRSRLLISLEDISIQSHISVYWSMRVYRNSRCRQGCTICVCIQFLIHHWAFSRLIFKIILIFVPHIYIWVFLVCFVINNLNFFFCF
jgi:hypothetical protein